MFNGGVMMFYGVLMVVKGWFYHEHSGFHGTEWRDHDDSMVISCGKNASQC